MIILFSAGWKTACCEKEVRNKLGINKISLMIINEPFLDVYMIHI